MKEDNKVDEVRQDDTIRQDGRARCVVSFCLVDDLGLVLVLRLLIGCDRADYGSGGLYEREDEMEAGMVIEYEATILVRRELAILTMTVLDLDCRRKCDSRTEW